MGLTAGIRKLQEALGPEAGIALNMMTGVTDNLALSGLQRELDLPHLSGADRFEGKLGRKILEKVYGPAWKKYERRLRRIRWPWKR